MKAKEIRARFLEFFAEHRHEVVSSSTLVPQDDPTLLFTNAGMNQFKGVFLGLETARLHAGGLGAEVHARLRQTQRSGGSGQGRPPPHLLRDAGQLVLRRLLQARVHPLGLGVPDRGHGPGRGPLWVSVYKDDDESFGIWEDEVGVPAERIVRLGDLEKGDEENFWSMADTGPCGPCTEIHYDQGEAMKCDHPDGCAVGVCDCDRWLELWNHVFMEFDRQEDGTLKPLPMKSVDTGLGFERLVAVMQGKQSNYETDLFTPLIAQDGGDLRAGRPRARTGSACRSSPTTPGPWPSPSPTAPSPRNEGRGYVVRRILRRAARHGHLLGLEEPFLFKVAAVVIDEMGEAYPGTGRAPGPRAGCHPQGRGALRPHPDRRPAGLRRIQGRHEGRGPHRADRRGGLQAPRHLRLPGGSDRGGGRGGRLHRGP